MKTMNPLQIIGHSSSLAPLISLWRRSVVASHHFLPALDVDFYEEVLHNALPHLEVWSACKGDELLGFMALDKQMLEMLFIDPPFFGQGAGRALLAKAMELKGTLRVYVNEQNPDAHKFYQAMGFNHVKRLAVDGSGKPYPLILMEWHS